MTTTTLNWKPRRTILTPPGSSEYWAGDYQIQKWRYAYEGVNGWVVQRRDADWHWRYHTLNALPTLREAKAYAQADYEEALK